MRSSALLAFPVLALAAGASLSAQDGALARFIHDLAGFSLDPPTGYSVVERGPLSVKFEGLRRNDVTPVLTVVRNDAPLPQPLEEFGNSVKAMVKNETESFTSLADANISVGDLQARRLVFAVQIKGRGYTFAQTVVRAGTHTLFSVDARVASRDWEAFAPAYEKCAASFRVDPPRFSPEEEKSWARSRSLLSALDPKQVRTGEQWLAILVRGVKQGYSHKRVVAEAYEAAPGKPAFTHERDVVLFLKDGRASRTRFTF